MLDEFVSDASAWALFSGCALALFGIGAVCTAAGLALERSAFAARHRVFSLDVPASQLRREKFAWVRKAIAPGGGPAADVIASRAP